MSCFRMVLGVLMASLIASGAQASSVRYALVVGNNFGRSPDGTMLSLARAESDAQSIADHLIRFGGFEPENTVVVTGAGRASVMAAAKDLARRHRRDRRTFGQLPTLFAFFYSGHGLQDQLLTPDRPITGADLEVIFGRVGADLSIGFFDACFSESLGGGLSRKGVSKKPGFNPFVALPEELLQSQGKIWLVSSEPDQYSYEDDELGGLLTHYFLKAFTEAEKEEPVISLGQMWAYAREKTSMHAARAGHNQTPVRMVRELKDRGPISFSFRSPRNAVVAFHSSVEGTFLVRSVGGLLAERVVKRAGEGLRVAVYPGKLVVTEIGGRERRGGVARRGSQTFEVGANDQVVIRPAPRLASVGSLRWKGQLLESATTAPPEEREFPPTTHFIAIGSWAARQDELAAPAWSGQIGLLFLDGGFSFTGEVSVGGSGHTESSWSVSTRSAGVRGSAGLGWELGDWRLDLEASAEADAIWLAYNGASVRHRLHALLWLGGGSRVLWFPPGTSHFAAMLRLQVGVVSTPSLGAFDESRYWAPGASIGLGVAWLWSDSE